uniref:solute carrier family 22 member 21-like n=1 Tax=Doryrhamphus excisus TaxID=161450 RepID=UPI0025ADD3D0|nr:solute carrier family 22 member 21-like [Doryrhamphus excisus]
MSNEKCRDFDEITSFLGDYGCFQILIIVLLSLSTIPCGYMAFLAVYITYTPAHHCKAWVNSTPYDLNGVTSFPERSTEAGTTGSCSRYQVQDANWTDTIKLGNGTDPCLDGWVFSTERYTIVSEWELVCENAWKIPFSTSVFYVGVLFGTFISGQLSDRFGRKLVLYATVALHSITALIQATSVNWLMFCVLNCVRGTGQVSSYLASLVLGSEMLCPSVRVSYTLLGHSLGFGIGYALLPLFAYFLRGWRWLLVASAIPGLLWLLTWRVIPESPRWLLLRGQVKEAEMVLRQAAKLNKIHAPEVLFLPAEVSELMKKTGEKEQTYSCMDLMNTANLRNITAIGLFIWIAVAMVFNGLSLNTSNLNGNIYLTCLMSAATDIVAYVFSWLLFNRVPRPTLLFVTLMFCGTMLLVIKLIPQDMHVTFQVLVLLGKMGVAIAYCFTYLVFAELFPTVVRNTGMGFLSSSARIGAIICPYVIHIGKCAFVNLYIITQSLCIYILHDHCALHVIFYFSQSKNIYFAGIYSKILPYIIFGAFSIVAALLSLLLPDTRNNKLPDLISEAKSIRSCCTPKKTLAAAQKATHSQA